MIMYYLKCETLSTCVSVPIQEDLTTTLYLHDFHNVNKVTYAVKFTSRTTSPVMFEFQRDAIPTSQGVFWPTQWRVCSRTQCDLTTAWSDSWLRQIFVFDLIVPEVYDRTREHDFPFIDYAFDGRDDSNYHPDSQPTTTILQWKSEA